MTINLYKISRGVYKLVVFSEKYGVETFKIKGKNEMRKKRKAIEELYGSLEKASGKP